MSRRTEGSPAALLLFLVVLAVLVSHPWRNAPGRCDRCAAPCSNCAIASVRS